MSPVRRGPPSGLLACLLVGLLLAVGCTPPPRSPSGVEVTPPGNSAGQTQPTRAR